MEILRVLCQLSMSVGRSSTFVKSASCQQSSCPVMCLFWVALNCWKIKQNHKVRRDLNTTHRSVATSAIIMQTSQTTLVTQNCGKSNIPSPTAAQAVSVASQLLRIQTVPATAHSKRRGGPSLRQTRVSPRLSFATRISSSMYTVSNLQASVQAYTHACVIVELRWTATVRGIKRGSIRTALLYSLNGIQRIERNEGEKVACQALKEGTLASSHNSRLSMQAWCCNALKQPLKQPLMQPLQHLRSLLSMH